MKTKRSYKHFMMFSHALLTIFLLFGSIKGQASGPMCSDVFGPIKTSPWITNYEKVSPAAKKFWQETGKIFHETVQKDIDHSIELYNQARDIKHPTIDFLQALGFQFKGDRFLVPDFFTLMKNLDYVQQKAQLPIKIQFLWTLKHKQYGWEQTHALSPFQDFAAEGMVYNTKTSLLPNDAFSKLVASGVFPLGGLESSSGLTRAEFNRYKEQKYKLEDGMLSDFMHDLAHLQALIYTPEFGVAQKEAMKKKEARWAQMEKREGIEAARQDRRKSDGDIQSFIFSESSWGFKPLYKEVLAPLKTVHSIIAEQSTLNGESLASRPVHEKLALKEDLRIIEKEWYKIVEPYGGASIDIVTVPHVQFLYATYQFPMNAVLKSLRNLNKKESEWSIRDYNDAALVLRFLREAPSFTPRGWEYFMVTSDKTKSKVYNGLRAIFAGHNGSEMSGFSALMSMLNIADPQTL